VFRPQPRRARRQPPRGFNTIRWMTSSSTPRLSVASLLTPSSAGALGNRLRTLGGCRCHTSGLQPHRRLRKEATIHQLRRLLLYPPCAGVLNKVPQLYVFTSFPQRESLAQRPGSGTTSRPSPSSHLRQQGLGSEEKLPRRFFTGVFHKRTRERRPRKIGCTPGAPRLGFQSAQTPPPLSLD